MKPSNVVLRAPLPLVGTFGKVEREAAATVILRTLIRGGDEFRAVTKHEMGVTIGLDLDEKVEPIYSLRNNPFWNPGPGFVQLADHGFCEFVRLYASFDASDPRGAVEVLTAEEGRATGADIRFTEKGIEALKRWVPAEPSTPSIVG